MTDERIKRFSIPTPEDLAPLKALPLSKDTDVGSFELGEIYATLRMCDEGDYGHERAIQACSKILGMHDVVSLDIEGVGHFTDEGIRHCPAFSYANAGDPYIVTLLRDHKAGQWIVSDYASVLEECEKENKVGDYEEFDEEPERCPSCHATDFELGTFERRREPMTDDLPKAGGSTATFDKPVIGYYFACTSCNHHCQTSEDFEPEVDSGPQSEPMCPSCQTPTNDGDLCGDCEDDDTPPPSSD
jgi:hypothetical protein